MSTLPTKGPKERVVAISEGVHRDMPDDVYHFQHTREEHFYSSSQLKTVLEDPQKFKEKYIDGVIDPTPQAMQDAFDVGTVAHTAILEPHRLKESYVKWTSTGNRTGKIWDEFKAQHPGKLILNKTMVKQAQNAIKMCKASAPAMEIINYETGEAEVSFFVTFMGLRMKVRADWLGPGYIGDLKTTSGDVRNEQKIKAKIKTLSYDLSAALYVDVVNYCIDYFELDMPYIETFYWIFASKDKKMCQVYDAKPYLPMGRAKYQRAIELIKENEANDWKFEEKIITLYPNAYEVGDWIKNEEEKEIDVDLL